MLKKCIENNCIREITSSCNCKDPEIYICDDHITEHIRLPGRHTLESLIIEIKDNSKYQIMPQLKEIIKSLKELKKNVFTNAKQLINIIERESTNSILAIKVLQKDIAKLLVNKIIPKENYEKILSFDLKIDRSVINRIEDIKKEIKNIFILNYNDRDLY